MGKVVLNADTEGIMRPDEVQKFVDWDRNGDMDPPVWCAEATAKLAVGKADRDVAGRVQYFYEYDSKCRKGLD